MRGLLNIMTERAHAALDTKAHSMPGIVTGYNPSTYSVKVALQPDNVETGWLPLLSQQVGAGWGIYSPPAIGDMVHVVFSDGEVEAGVVVGAYYNNEDVPMPVPSGEIVLKHKTGSLLHFRNDGSVHVVAAGDLTAEVAGDLTATVHGESTLTTAKTTVNSDVQVNGDLQVSGHVRDLDGAHGSLNDLRTTYNGHNHGGVRSGSDNSAPPNQTI